MLAAVLVYVVAGDGTMHLAHAADEALVTPRTLCDRPAGAWRWEAETVLGESATCDRCRDAVGLEPLGAPARRVRDTAGEKATPRPIA